MIKIQKVEIEKYFNKLFFKITKIGEINSMSEDHIATPVSAFTLIHFLKMADS